MKKFSVTQALFLTFIPIFILFICLCAGRMKIDFPDVAGVLLGKSTEQTRTVILSMRLPRILMACLVGAGLSVSGCVFQSLFANPLASPDTLGVASGASFGAALALLLGFGGIILQVFSFGFGILAVIVTYLASGKKGDGRISMILSGIMIGSLFSSLVSLVKFTADTESVLPSITYWLMGSLNNAGYDSLKIGLPVIALCVIIFILLRWKLNLLPLSDDESKTFGVNIRLLRAVSIICATAITASCVAMCGLVGWVGLLVPHICRMKFGNNHVLLIPACVSTGMCFMMLVDTLARTLTASEIPISVLTAMVGAPFFIILMRKSGGQSL